MPPEVEELLLFDNFWKREMRPMSHSPHDRARQGSWAALTECTGGKRK